MHAKPCVWHCRGDVDGRMRVPGGPYRLVQRTDLDPLTEHNVLDLSVPSEEGGCRE